MTVTAKKLFFGRPSQDPSRQKKRFGPKIPRPWPKDIGPIEKKPGKTWGEWPVVKEFDTTDFTDHHHLIIRRIANGIPMSRNKVVEQDNNAVQKMAFNLAVWSKKTKGGVPVSRKKIEAIVKEINRIRDEKIRKARFNALADILHEIKKNGFLIPYTLLSTKGFGEIYLERLNKTARMLKKQ